MKYGVFNRMEYVFKLKIQLFVCFIFKLKIQLFVKKFNILEIVKNEIICREVKNE